MWTWAWGWVPVWTVITTGDVPNRLTIRTRSQAQMLTASGHPSWLEHQSHILGAHSPWGTLGQLVTLGCSRTERSSKKLLHLCLNFPFPRSNQIERGRSQGSGASLTWFTSYLHCSTATGPWEDLPNFSIPVSSPVKMELSRAPWPIESSSAPQHYWYFGPIILCCGGVRALQDV